MTPINVRQYDYDGFDAVDTLYRVKLNEYRLHLTVADHPTEPREEWKDFNAVQARQWLSECPEQFVKPSATILQFPKRRKEPDNV